jgi:hypothetical protein
MPDDTVYVLDPPALPADQVMVVITDSCLVERGRIRGLDAPHKSRL